MKKGKGTEYMFAFQPLQLKTQLLQQPRPISVCWYIGFQIKQHLTACTKEGVKRFCLFCVHCTDRTDCRTCFCSLLGHCRWQWWLRSLFDVSFWWAIVPVSSFQIHGVPSQGTATLVQGKKTPIWRDELAWTSSQLSSDWAQQRWPPPGGVGVRPKQEHKLQRKKPLHS